MKNKSVLILGALSDIAKSIAQKYGVRSIPNILVFKNGNIEQQLVGNVPEAEIANVLDKLI